MAGIIVLVAIAVGALLLAVLLSRSGFTSDKALIRKFHEQRAEFEQLRDLVAADPVLAEFHEALRHGHDIASENHHLLFVSETRAYPADRLDPERVDRYRDLLERLDLPDGVEVRASGTIRFIASSFGYVSHHDKKGFAYRLAPPDTLCGDLDEALMKLQWNPDIIVDAFRHIEGPWYLYIYGD